MQLRLSEPRDDDSQWLLERHRFALLEHVYRRTGGDCSVEVRGQRLVEELRFSREETFRIIHDLEHRGFLLYVGSGPRVRLTPGAVEFLTREAGRRRSVRDAGAS